MEPVSTTLGIISLLGSLFGGGKSDQPVTTQTTDPALSAMLKTQNSRMQMQNPLYQAVTQLAMGLLPTKYQLPITGYSAAPTTDGYGYPMPDPTPPNNAGNPPSYFQTPNGSYLTPDQLRDRRHTLDNPAQQ